MKNLIATLLIICLNLSLVQAEPIRIMTYNIRLDASVDGVNQWGKRLGKVIDLLHQEHADIICVQEALPNQIKDLQTNLPGYGFIGVGREDGKQKGEYSAIFYTKNKFEVMSSNTFWLSTSPDKPGSIGWDAAITRICTYAHLKVKNESKSFWVFNTHFDHVGEKAREQSAKLILKKIEGIAGKAPVVLCGDFNSEPNSVAYQTILSNTLHPFFDTYMPQEKECTFTGFDVNSDICKRIDFIFTDQKIQAGTNRIINQHDGKYYPSDHLPVILEFNLLD